MSRYLIRWIVALSYCLLFLVTTIAWAPAAAASTRQEDPAIAESVRMLVNPTVRQSLTVPTDFADVMGYVPVVSGSLLINPEGGCSSPVTLPTEFDEPCRAHDLGYDMLRYATAENHPLGAWARQAIDGRLAADMRDACGARLTSDDRASCLVWANTAATAVNANSWRQGYGDPVRESLLPGIIAAGALGVCSLGLFAVWAVRR